MFDCSLAVQVQNLLQQHFQELDMFEKELIHMFQLMLFYSQASPKQFVEVHQRQFPAELDLQRGLWGLFVSHDE